MAEDAEPPHSKLVARAITNLPPCALQFHPVDTSLLVLGTYKLEEMTKTRHGSLDFYRFDQETSSLSLVASHSTPDSSILDVKINTADPYLIATAQSTGSAILWRIDPNTLGVKAKKECQLSEDTEVLVLSLAFSPQDPNQFSATFSNGEVAVCSITDNGSAAKLQGYTSNEVTTEAHSLEAWISAFGSSQQNLGNVLFSGGDDAILRAHDIRISSQGPSDEDTTIFKTRNIHGAGITSILPPGTLPTTGTNGWSSSGHDLWTGGYDDDLKSVDLRMLDGQLTPYYVPRVNSSLGLGGGVWKLIPSPISDKLLACCMYGGARVLQPLPADEFTPARVLETITEGHESMVYGGDWRADGQYIATCSFYDKVIQVWEA